MDVAPQIDVSGASCPVVTRDEDDDRARLPRLSPFQPPFQSPDYRACPLLPQSSPGTRTTTAPDYRACPLFNPLFSRPTARLPRLSPFQPDYRACPLFTLFNFPFQLLTCSHLLHVHWTTATTHSTQTMAMRTTTTVLFAGTTAPGLPRLSPFEPVHWTTATTHSTQTMAMRTTTTVLFAGTTADYRACPHSSLAGLPRLSPFEPVRRTTAPVPIRAPFRACPHSSRHTSPS